MLNSQDVRNASNLHVTIDSFRKLHFGGLISKILWCILGLSPLILAFSGLYLYWYKNRNKKIFSKRTITQEIKSY